MSLWREGFYCRIVTEGLGETHKDVRDPVSSLNHVCGMVGWTSMTPTPSPSSPCLIALLWRQFCSPSTLPHRSLPVGATPGFASGSYLEICPYTAFHIPLPEILILISSGFWIWNKWPWWMNLLMVIQSSCLEKPGFMECLLGWLKDWQENLNFIYEQSSFESGKPTSFLFIIGMNLWFLWKSGDFMPGRLVSQVRQDSASHGCRGLKH